MPNDAFSGTYSTLSAAAVLWAACSLTSYSSFVRTALVPKLAGRCIGTLIMSVAGHNPWRSGSPHEVLGWVQGFEGALAFAAGFCAGGGAWPATGAREITINPPTKVSH